MLLLVGTGDTSALGRPSKDGAVEGLYQPLFQSGALDGCGVDLKSFEGGAAVAVISAFKAPFFSPCNDGDAADMD